MFEELLVLLKKHSEIIEGDEWFETRDLLPEPSTVNPHKKYSLEWHQHNQGDYKRQDWLKATTKLQQTLLRLEELNFVRVKTKVRRLPLYQFLPGAFADFQRRVAERRKRMQQDEATEG